MQIGKVISTSITKNKAGFEQLLCTVELRRNENVTAEWINNLGESATPIIGEWVVVTVRTQAIGGFFAFGFADIINQIFAERGVKIIYGRDSEGTVKTKISLTDSEIIIENPSSAQLTLSGSEIIMNQGNGAAVEHERLQAALDQFSQLLLTEFQKVAAGTEPNPSAPYVPSPSLPADITNAKSETIILP